MPSVLNFKNFFRKAEESTLQKSFRHPNYLNSLGAQALANLVNFIEQKGFPDLLPECGQKNTAVIAYPSCKFILERLSKKNATIVNYQIEPFIVSQTVQSFTLGGNLKPLSLRAGAFDLVVAPVSSQLKTDWNALIPSFSECLNNGGRFVFAVFHPFLEILLHNQNPASVQKAQTSLALYFNTLKDNHLYIEACSEGIIDKDAKPFFTGPEGEKAFEEFRGLPLVLFLRAVKYVKESKYGL